MDLSHRYTVQAGMQVTGVQFLALCDHMVQVNHVRVRQ